MSTRRNVSVNVTDGMIRLGTADLDQEVSGLLHRWLTMTPTAYTFRRGHQVRLQISSGMYPRVLRNLGTGEPIRAPARCEWHTSKCTWRRMAHSPSCYRPDRTTESGRPSCDIACSCVPC